jgi:glycosyltransferase involved in cell wall biosynthesis
LLLVAYPLLPVSEASAGGAEQILFTLERGLMARGWQTEVAACAGSVVSGKLIDTGAAVQVLDGFAEREREHTERAMEACANSEFAMVLDHSGHFFRHVSRSVFRNAGRIRGCVLATLHLPRALYDEQSFEGLAENVYFNFVSDSQRAEFMGLPQVMARVLGVVRNGIAVERFALAERKSDYVLWLGRVCPEKAPHLAIEAAKLAGVRIKLAGQVYPFRWHTDYWEQKVKPLIDGDRVQWIPLPSFAEKTRLLREARALLVTSQVAETTSLVALEAMASGTAVIAFGAGALPEVVPKGTGFIVGGVAEMAAACGRVSEIRAQDCRDWVQQEYSAQAMTDGYEALIAGLQGQKRWAEPAG